MAIRYEYTYTEYKDFPEATEISKSREASVYPLFMLCCLSLLGSIIALIIGEWLAIFGVIVSVAAFYYLFRIYPKVTERKIKKAIKRRIELTEEIKNSKYKCKYIKVLNSEKCGTCFVCYSKNTGLKLCKVKNDIGTREIYICESCKRQYEENSKS